MKLAIFLKSNFLKIGFILIPLKSHYSVMIELSSIVYREQKKGF